MFLQNNGPKGANSNYIECHNIACKHQPKCAGNNNKQFIRKHARKSSTHPRKFLSIDSFIQIVWDFWQQQRQAPIFQAEIYVTHSHSVGCS